MPSNVNYLKAHLALNVQDVETSILFYTKMFGVEPSKVRPGYAKFNVENPPLNFTLNQKAGVAAGAISHLGFQVASTDDVLATRKRWEEAGLGLRDEMNVACCYARQDKTWVHDPDGNEWEVFVVLEDNLAKNDAQSAACCPAPQEREETRENAGACCSPSAEEILLPAGEAKPAACCAAV